MQPATGRELHDVISALAGADARPRPDQARAVEALVDERRRVLVVQATGWGKSAVYWAATAALRARGGGVTLVVSPLLALMRDQIAAAERAGLRAATVNSTNVEEWDGILGQLGADRLDVLLISPERLANPRFADRLAALAAGVGMVVIDEAHCISDWGFDFRPDYQRLAGVLLALAPDTPVLATTATANLRVTADVAAQLGPDTVVLRGTLARASLELAVLPPMGPLDRYAWVADGLAHLDGSGIVYVLTVAEAERLADVLADRGHRVAAYTGQLDNERRQDIEALLLANRLKAVVATSALGMGFDKPDLGFVVHLGSPASPVGYYQQVGRAGRAIGSATAVLLPSAQDEGVWRYFATSTVPDPDHAQAVLSRLAEGPARLADLEALTTLRRGRLEALLKVLAVDGAVVNGPRGWERTDRQWTYDHVKYAELLAVRAAEADLMRRYAAGAGCLMEFLRRALDDPDPGPCGRCSVCTGRLPEPGARPSAATAAAVRRFLRGRETVLERRKLWPGPPSGRKGRIEPGSEAGRALADADDPAWTAELEALDQGDRPCSAEVGDGLAELVRRWVASGELPADLSVVPVPSRRRPRLVRSLAERAATALGAPLIAALEVTGPAPPTEVASAARAAALLATMGVVAGTRLAGPVLLVDDVWRTGWTVTVAAALLREAGAGTVHPLVLQRRP